MFLNFRYDARASRPWWLSQYQIIVRKSSHTQISRCLVCPRRLVSQLRNRSKNLHPTRQWYCRTLSKIDNSSDNWNLYYRQTKFQSMSVLDEVQTSMLYCHRLLPWPGYTLIAHPVSKWWQMPTRARCDVTGLRHTRSYQSSTPSRMTTNQFQNSLEQKQRRIT